MGSKIIIFGFIMEKIDIKASDGLILKTIYAKAEKPKTMLEYL